MKILITGVTSRMYNSQRLKNKYVTCEAILPRVLEALGHTVHHRAVETGEDLSGYDLAFLGVTHLTSFTSSHAAQTGYALTKIKRRVLFCGDWSIEKAGSMTRNALEHWERTAKFLHKAFKYTAEELSYAQLLARNFAYQDVPLVAPFFPWGQHDLILGTNLPKAKLLTWDPTPFVDLAAVEVPAKERRWIYGALQENPWLRGQRTHWPVTVHDTDNRVLEDQLVAEYASSWGVLGAPYKTAGSGWWRVRFNHAAHVGSVMICGPKDSAPMGSAYQKSISEVESMSDAELQSTAQQQREWLFENTATKAQTLEAIQKALDAAA